MPLYGFYRVHTSGNRAGESLMLPTAEIEAPTMEQAETIWNSVEGPRSEWERKKGKAINTYEIKPLIEELDFLN